MTREEFLKAITEYNIKVSALHNLYYIYIDSPIVSMFGNISVSEFNVKVDNDKINISYKT